MRRHRNRSMSISSLEELETRFEGTAIDKDSKDNEDDEEEFVLIDNDLPEIFHHSSSVHYPQEKTNYIAENNKLSFLETEQKVNQQLQHINKYYRVNSPVSQVEGCLELVCSCIKEAICDDKLLFTKNYQKNNKESKLKRSFSMNSMNELKFKDLINNMLRENDYFKASVNSNFSNISNCSTKESIRDILFQNIEIEDRIKILTCSNNNAIKNRCLSNFMEDFIPDDYLSKGLEIRQKTISLMEKKICVEFFDTEEFFFTKNSSQVYFQIANSFFIFCDLNSKGNGVQYVKQKYHSFKNFFPDKKMIIIELMSDRKNKQIHNELKYFCIDKGIILLQIKNESDFDIKYHKINSLFKLLLIKKKKNIPQIKNKNSMNKDNNDDLVNDRLNFDSEYKIEKIHFIDRKYATKLKKFRRKCSIDY